MCYRLCRWCLSSKFSVLGFPWLAPVSMLLALHESVWTLMLIWYVSSSYRFTTGLLFPVRKACAVPVLIVHDRRSMIIHICWILRILKRICTIILHVMPCHAICVMLCHMLCYHILCHVCYALSYDHPWRVRKGSACRTASPQKDGDFYRSLETTHRFV